MTITAVYARQLLARWVGPWIALADIEDALGRGLLSLGISPLTYGDLVDADFQGVQSDQYPQLLDIAEYEAVVSACANCDEVQLQLSGISCPEEKARLALTRRVEMKQAMVKSTYGYTLPTLQGGVVNLETNATMDQIPYGEATEKDVRGTRLRDSQPLLGPSVSGTGRPCIPDLCRLVFQDPPLC